MGLFIKLMVFLVILAVVLLFVLKGPDGEPLMTVSDLEEPAEGLSGAIERLPEVQNPFADEPTTKKEEKSGKTKIYSWRDEQGNMHFTNQPPEAGQQAATIQVNPDINVMPAVKVPESGAESH